jgi:hypothetical protein
MDKALDNSITDPPSQKPPPPLKEASKNEKSDAPIVGIGQQLEDASPAFSWGATSTSTSTSTSNSDVKDNNDRLLATYLSNTNPIQSNPIEKDPLPILMSTVAHLI